MTLVRAISVGYFGGVIREPGDKFEVDDELWADKKRRPSWAEAVKFGDKGDHDGDGKDGGSLPADETKGKPGRKPKAEPFEEAPEPTVAKGNGVKETLGVEPDWVAPKPID
jgi:hypothetical protein